MSTMPHEPGTLEHDTGDAARLREQAAALDKNADMLAEQARDLRRGAADLRIEAERLEREPLRMLRDVSAPAGGNGGGNDMAFMTRVCELLAGSPPLSSGDVAEHLNVSPTRARTALARLEAIGMIRKRGLKRGTRYELADEAEDEAPTPFGQDYATVVRDTATRLDTFDFATIQRELPDLAEGTLRRWLAEWVSRGVLESAREGNRKIYAYVKPEGESPARPKNAPPELAVARDAGISLPKRADPVAGTGRPMGVGASKAVAELAREARKAGVRIEKEPGGHLRWIAPSGGYVRSSSTPGASSMKQTRADLRKLGVVGV